MVLAGVLALLHDMGVVDVQNQTVLLTDHADTVPLPSGKAQGLSEDPPLAQMLQDRPVSHPVDPHQSGGALQHHTYLAAGTIVDADHLLGLVAHLPHSEALHHARNAVL